MKNNNNRLTYLLPIILSLTLVIGFWLGSMLGAGAEARLLFRDQAVDKAKFNQVLDYIEQEYVDTVDKNKLVETSIQELLQSLDPHSAYIPAEDVQEMSEPLEGNFGGIGIEFNIIDDTVVVVSPVAGGPSEVLGILPGDRIVKVEGKNIAGINIQNKDVMEKLRGPEGTNVSISIRRKGVKKLLDFRITRGEIPIHSVDADYMIDKQIGYIKVSRFASNTYDEFMEAQRRLRTKGMTSLILDFRGNPGGYLNAATKMADEFLGNKTLIVYTEGKARPKQHYYATGQGDLEDMPLIILVDEGSASASEIVSGAMQDNDRATIVGRRTFGKGLVQEGSTWPDGSSIRLTVARYYTPTGRSIQVPYNQGTEDYYNEFYKRFENGELEKMDSSKLDESLKYTTPKGKTVYGGGGIMPDVFIPADTTGFGPYLSEVAYRGLINEFAFSYADRNREMLKAMGIEKFLKNFSIDQAMMTEFVNFTEMKGLRAESSQVEKSASEIRLRLKALIGRQIWKNEGFYPVINQNDKAMQAGIEILKKK